VATSQRTTRCLHLAVVLAVSALAVVLTPTAGEATPQTPQTAAEAKARILELNEKLEPIVEKYNAAQLQLTKKQQAQKRAAKQAQQLDARLESLSGKVRQMASAAYRSVPFGEFTSVMTSRSPQQFLDQLSALDTIAMRRGETIESLQQAKAEADRAQQTARKAASDAKKLFDQLKAQKSTIEQQVQQTQALLDRLSQAERAALFSGGGSSTTSCSSLTGLPAPPNAQAKAAVDAALSKCGSPYVWAAAGPSSFDCSGLTMWAWQHGGVSLPHQSGEQYNSGTHVSQSELLPGDLVFFYSPIHHVGLYIGNGLMVHAPQTGDVVKVTPIGNFPYTGATRVW
jgi:peptidoglycan DL-endopeptidase CwlO